MRKLFLLIALLAAISITPQTQAQTTSALTSAKLATRQNGEVKSSDSRVVALETVLNKYKSPLTPYASFYVKYADENDLDWKLLPGIAGLESTFGRFMIDGTYNAYGWGSGQIYFKDWEDGIKTINQALRENYKEKWGAETVAEIGPIYAESPTWSSRVSYFMDEINDVYIDLTSSSLDLNI